MKTLIFQPGGNVRVLADSAVGRNRQPWFLPEFGSDWKWHTASALRISRLGKGIRPEFADRYAADRSLAWIPEADANPAAEFMDGAVIIGDWMPIGPAGLTGRERDAIATAARFATLKQGDVIILEEDNADICIPIRINDRIHIESADGHVVLEFNIK